MPTPMPIIAATAVVNSGTSSTRVTRPMSAAPQPTPKSAVMIGSPIASSEPKAMSRMMIAAAMPTNSLEKSGCAAKMKPPSSTWRPSTLTSSRRSLMIFGVVGVLLVASRSAKLISA